LTDVRNAEVASVRMALSNEQRIHMKERFAEAARELGILWLIFAPLDRLVAGTFTFTWGLINGISAIAVWLFGLYIEIQMRRL
jgi:hypothetical protein